MFVKLCVLIGSVAFASAGPLITQLLQSPQLSVARGLLQSDTKLLKQGLDFAQELVEYGYGVVTTGSASATYAARVGLGNAAKFGSAAVHGGVKVANDGLELLKSASTHVPAYSNLVAQEASHLSAMLNKLIVIVGYLVNIADKADRILVTSNNKVQHLASNLRMMAENSINAGKASVFAVDKVKDVTDAGKKVFHKLFGWFLGDGNNDSSMVPATDNSGDGIGRRIFKNLTGAFLGWFDADSPVNGGRSIQQSVAVRVPENYNEGYYSVSKLPAPIQYYKVDTGQGNSGSTISPASATGAAQSTTDASHSTTTASAGFMPIVPQYGTTAAAHEATEQLTNAVGTLTNSEAKTETIHRRESNILGGLRKLIGK